MWCFVDHLWHRRIANVWSSSPTRPDQESSASTRWVKLWECWVQLSSRTTPGRRLWCLCRAHRRGHRIRAWAHLSHWLMREAWAKMSGLKFSQPKAMRTPFWSVTTKELFKMWSKKMGPWQVPTMLMQRHVDAWLTDSRIAVSGVAATAAKKEKGEDFQREKKREFIQREQKITAATNPWESLSSVWEKGSLESRMPRTTSADKQFRSQRHADHDNSDGTRRWVRSPPVGVHDPPWDFLRSHWCTSTASRSSHSRFRPIVPKQVSEIDVT